MFEKMKQLMDMQKIAKETERRLGEIKIERAGLGGKVKVVATANQKVESISIDESLLLPAGRSALETGVAALINDALAEGKKEAARAALDLMKGFRG